MPVWIALFRGINVGGNNILPMAELRSDLEGLKFENVQTYIQSGNVVFSSAASNPSALAARISRRIETRHGFRPQVVILTPDVLQNAIKINPFAEAVSDPKSLHFFFLAKAATHPKLLDLEQAKTSTEKYKLIDRVFYLHAPDGIGRSKLAANAERFLGVPVTARNYRTVDKIKSLVTDRSAQ